MIYKLKLKNFILFKDEEINFNNGMTSLVGQTGAGKTIIFQAIKILSGMKNDKKFIRKNSSKYTVEGHFDLKEVDNSRLNKIKQIVELDDENLEITRTLSIDGKGQIRLNGVLITLAELKKVMKLLIDIHEQNSADSLLETSNQTQLIDSLIEQELIKNYKDELSLYLIQKKELKNLILKSNTKDEELEILDYKINKIKNIKNFEHEDIIEEKLEISKKNIKNKETTSKILKHINIIENSLSEIQYLDNKNSVLENQKIEAINNLISEISHNLSMQERNDGEELFSEYSDKLTQIRSLKRKYNLDFDGLVQKMENLEKQKKKLENLSDEIIQKEKELKNTEKELKKISTIITKEREAISKSLEEKINIHFQKLEMNEAQLKITFETKEFGANGDEEVLILLKTNKGHDFSKIESIASGGEKSRIMLIIKKVFNDINPISLMLLDEIDQGVSSKVAVRIGNLIEEISKKTQVVLISHSPQVLNQTKELIKISKKNDDELTYSVVKKLNLKEKENFINKMIQL